MASSEETGKEEVSLIQNSYPPAPPRRYYRLTEAGKRATLAELSDPIMTLYNYPRLEFIYDREFVTAYDLMNRFGYRDSSARCRLSQLRKEGFIASCGRGQWCLTDKGYKKLDYHGVLQKKEAEELRRQRRAEGRLWFVDVGGRIRMPKWCPNCQRKLEAQEIKKGYPLCETTPIWLSNSESKTFNLDS